MNVEDIKPLLHDVYHRIVNADQLENLGVGLFSGIAGAVIYCFNYGVFFNDPNAKEFAYELLQRSLEVNEISSHTYCNGASGLCSMLLYLCEENFIDSENAIKITDLFDEYISYSMLRDAEMGNNDLLHGSLGSALYLLQRNNSVAKASVCKLVDILDSTKIQQDDMYYWTSPICGENPAKINIGFAHGLSSFATFFIQAYRMGVLKSKTKELLSGLCSFLQTQRNSESSSEISLFPTFSSNFNEMRSSRLGWCYGDLGIARSIQRSCSILKDSQLEMIYQRAFSLSLKRTTLKDAFINDSSICHGAGGLYLIYKQQYEITSNIKFSQAMSLWLYYTYTLLNKELSSNDGLNSLSLLDGSSGSALVLLSAIAPSSTSWVKLFLY